MKIYNYGNDYAYQYTCQSKENKTEEVENVKNQDEGARAENAPEARPAERIDQRTDAPKEKAKEKEEEKGEEETRTEKLRAAEKVGKVR